MLTSYGWLSIKKKDFEKDYGKLSVALHKKIVGKIAIAPKTEIRNLDDLSTVYSPGVAEPCRQIVCNPEKVYQMTMKANSIAVVSDGSAVLGLGNIGAEAAIPVMEGKAILFKKYANIDAIPICLKTQDYCRIFNSRYLEGRKKAIEKKLFRKL